MKIYFDFMWVAKGNRKLWDILPQLWFEKHNHYLESGIGWSFDIGFGWLKSGCLLKFDSRKIEDDFRPGEKVWLITDDAKGAIEVILKRRFNSVDWEIEENNDASYHYSCFRKLNERKSALKRSFILAKLEKEQIERDLETLNEMMEAEFNESLL